MEANAEVVVFLYARYLYLPRVVNFVPDCKIENMTAEDVPYVAGAVGFDFMRLFVVEMESGDVFSHKIYYPETYYWGQEILSGELFHQDQIDKLGLNVDRYVLTEWGGVLPLCENELVISTPLLEELPANMQ